MPRVCVTVGGEVANRRSIEAVPDSGADRTACGLDILEMLNIDVANLCDSATDLRAR